MNRQLRYFQNSKTVNIGYARVSTEEQELGLLVQTEKLQPCDLIFIEKESGGKDDRTEFRKAIKLAKELAKQGKQVRLTVYKLDRLTRKMSTLLELIEDLNDYGIRLVSIKEQIETDSLTGKLLCLILGYVAEMELDAIRDRTRDGLQKAREKGVKLGRKPISDKQEKEVIARYQQGEKIATILQKCQISKTTLYNVLKKHEISRTRLIYRQKKSIIKTCRKRPFY